MSSPNNLRISTHMGQVKILSSDEISTGPHNHEIRLDGKLIKMIERYQDLYFEGEPQEVSSLEEEIEEYLGITYPGTDIDILGDLSCIEVSFVDPAKEFAIIPCEGSEFAGEHIVNLDDVPTFDLSSIIDKM